MPPMKAEGPVPAGRWVGAPSVYPGVQLRPRAAFHEHVSPVGPSTADGGPVSLRRTLGDHRRFFRIHSLVKELQHGAFCGHLAAWAVLVRQQSGDVADVA